MDDEEIRAEISEALGRITDTHDLAAAMQCVQQELPRLIADRYGVDPGDVSDVVVHDETHISAKLHGEPYDICVSIDVVP